MGGGAEKCNFLVKKSKKCLKTPLWPVFTTFCLRRGNVGQNRVFVVLVLWQVCSAIEMYLSFKNFLTEEKVYFVVAIHLNKQKHC